MSSLLTSVVRCEEYSYTYTIDNCSDDAIADAEKHFAVERDRGVIVGDFWGPVWILRDESKAEITITFDIDEINYARIGQDKFGCTRKDYDTAMRITLTAYFGAATATIKNIANALLRLANDLTENSVCVQSGCEQTIQKFLHLLPGDTVFRDTLLDDLEDAIFDHKQQAKEAQYGRINNCRTLSYYQSYLRFDRIVNDFWATADETDRLLYFPLVFWWRLTAILPLRPSEFVLIPRNCVYWLNDKAHLTIRRTKVKGTNLGCKYTIKEDYIAEEYVIPSDLAHDIEAYIDSTKVRYNSDIDNLFCRATQKHLLSKQPPERRKYLYDDLYELLNLFYTRIVLTPKYGYVLRDKGTLPLRDGEIEQICLGDTRHIAMISLQLMGGSELICQMLSGHDCIDTGVPYYEDVRTFADAVVLERVRPSQNSHSYETTRLPDVYTDICGGLCRSEKVYNGDYSDCVKAVSPDGEIGHCQSCSYFCAPLGHQVPRATKPDDGNLRIAYVRVIDAVAKARQGIPLHDLTAATEQLQAEMIHYINQGSYMLEDNSDGKI